MQISLRAARMNVPLTQKEAAEKIGINADTLRRWERGESFPDVLQLRKIEEVYRIHYNEIDFYP